MSIYKVRGVGGELEVFEDKVVITPKGVMGGLGGIRSIPFGSITGIDHKKAGFVLPGHIMFQGGGVLATHQNSFSYKKDANAVIQEIKEYIERRTKEISSRPSSVSLADELTKLSNLRKQGILSEEEFKKAKEGLIG